MNLIANFGNNWDNVFKWMDMLNECKRLGIKFVKMQMFLKAQVPKDVKKMHINEIKAKFFFEKAKEKNIELFFTPMYPGAIDICEKLGVKYYKIRYLDRNNLILYRRLKKIKNIKDKIIFVSCQAPKETIFRNMAKYQGNVRFLYCVPKYPAQFRDYFKPEIYRKGINGIEDNTSNFDLFKDSKLIFDWFEISVCRDRETAYAGDWSKTFEELKIKEKEVIECE